MSFNSKFRTFSVALRLMRNTILVAEDEEYNFTLLKLIFEKEGQEIIWAKNGEEAVNLFRSNSNVNLVLMDIKMPVLNGLEATRIIKEIRKDIPVIAITAYAMSEDRDMCLSAGCNEFITKPIDRSNLLSIARKWINF